MKALAQHTALWLAILVSGCTDRALGLFDPNQDVAGTDLDGATAPPDLLRAPGSLPLVYCERIVVLSDSGALALFDPVLFTFEDSARLDCPAVGATGAYSMSLDRDGKLWVVDSNGALFIADVQTGACAPTSFVVGQHDIRRFDMSFAPDGPSGQGESLYLSAFSDVGPSQLAKIDPATLTVSSIGPLPMSAELTTTATGELWGLFRGNAPHAGRIDKESAVVAPDFHLGSLLGGISGLGVAFSSFRGSFYIFLLSDESGSRVYRLSQADGSIEKIVSKSGRRLIGATVATCLP